MCLHVKSREPKDIVFKNGLAKVYKIVYPTSRNTLVAPIMSTVYSPGLNIAKGKLDNGNIINGGAIHVFTNLNKAIDYASEYEVIIPVFVKKKDFIAEGYYNQAAFKAIYISKKIYNKALKATAKDQLV